MPRKSTPSGRRPRRGTSVATIPTAPTSSQFDALERRCLLTAEPWGTPNRLIRQDIAATQYPSIDGTGQVIAVIDTGIDYNHAALGGGIGSDKKVIAGYDFFDNDADPMDTDGHGTQVAGMIGSALFESGGFLYRGIAPSAKLIALRIAPSTNDVDLRRIEDALKWVSNNAAQYSIDVVNISFGYGRFTGTYTADILSDEFDILRTKDIVIVTSSGNGGTDDGLGITYPAADPDTISVGAVSGSDIIADFTQRASNLDFLAPGEDIRTTSLDDTFFESSGTSFAAPIVAGTIALLKQASPGISYNDILSVLRASSRPNLDGDAETGTVSNVKFPRIDVYAALSLADQRKAASPEVQATVGFAGNNNAVAVDAQGITHLLYFDSADNTMKYAVKQAIGQWSTPRIVDGSNLFQGQYISMQLDSWGRPNVAYFDGTAGDLKYAILDSTLSQSSSAGVSWKTTTIDGTGSVGLYPAIVLDANDTPHISYYRRSSGDLRLAQYYPGSSGTNSNGWRILDVDLIGDVGRSGVITTDIDGRLAIAYESSTLGKVRLARQTNAISESQFPTWNISTVQSSAPGAPNTVGAGWISLAIDTLNRAHIAFYNIAPADLNYALQTGPSSFDIQTLASRRAIGQYTQIFLQDNAPSILYYNRAGNGYNRADLIDGAWQTTSVQSNAGRFLSLGDDRSRTGGHVYTYYDSNTATLVLMSL
jgi:subtilisin family serine protease